MLDVLLAAASDVVELLGVGVMIGVAGVGVAPGVVSAGASYKYDQHLVQGDISFSQLSHSYGSRRRRLLGGLRCSCLLGLGSC